LGSPRQIEVEESRPFATTPNQDLVAVGYQLLKVDVGADTPANKH
jgi:hypothetical protein